MVGLLIDLLILEWFSSSSSSTWTSSQRTWNFYKFKFGLELECQLTLRKVATNYYLGPLNLQAWAYVLTDVIEQTANKMVKVVESYHQPDCGERAIPSRSTPWQKREWSEQWRSRPKRLWESTYRSEPKFHMWKALAPMLLPAPSLCAPETFVSSGKW